MFAQCLKIVLKLSAMPTFKVLVRPPMKNDGTYNVKIRITHNRESKYIKTPYYVSEKDLSKKKKDGRVELKIKNHAIIDTLEEVVLGYKKKLLSAGLGVESWNMERLIKYIETDEKTFKLDFIEYCRRYVDNVRSEGRSGTARQYGIAINALIRFIGRENLDVSEINYSFLKAFENHLRNEPVYKGIRSGEAIATDKPKKGRAISLYISCIKTIYERAKDEYNDEECGIINIPYSPFKKYKIPEVPISEHRTLTIQQIQSIIDLPYKVVTRRGLPEYNTAKDVFLISFALMGINTADLYEIKSFDGDVLAYNRRKTRTRRKDMAEMKVRIEPQIKALVEKYRGKEHAFIFGEYYSTPLNFNKIVNKGLKAIGKQIGVPNLNYYYARHSMASICANKLGIDIARVDEMLNHSDPKLALSRVYIERDFTPLWEANKRLLKLFDWSFYE